MYKFRFNNKLLKERRRELRANQTDAEKKLWEALRGERLDGLKFHRQFSIGAYILDFYCKEKRLLIEIDGGIHMKTEAKKNDEVRDKYFKEINFKILRFKNNDIEKDIDMVVEKIKSYF